MDTKICDKCSHKKETEGYIADEVATKLDYNVGKFDYCDVNDAHLNTEIWVSPNIKIKRQLECPLIEADKG